jgi:hypothetical protein
MVKCNRYASLDHIEQMPTVRLVGNAGLTFLVKMASGYWNNFDPANGYLAVRTCVLERLDLEKLPKRYYFESGLLSRWASCARSSPTSRERPVRRRGLLPFRAPHPRSSSRPDSSPASSAPPLALFRAGFLGRFRVPDLGIPMLLFGSVFAPPPTGTIPRSTSSPVGVVMIGPCRSSSGSSSSCRRSSSTSRTCRALPISPPLRRA